MTDPRDIIVGIDLGTTHSLIAYADEAGPRLIPGPGGAEDVLLPSVVGFDEQGRVRTLGHEARRHAVERPLHTVYSVKRLMGRGYSESRAEAERLSYHVVPLHADAARDVAAVQVGDRTYTPPEISAMILRELKQRAERHFGHEVRRAVITVPAQFDDAQRQATRDAGEIAGLEVVRIINEPTAAALAYGLDRREQATVAVYDLGGGTFDISILRLEDGVFEVLSTYGDTHLGGDDLDRALMDLLVDEVGARFGMRIDSPAIRQQLRTLAEQVRIRLSTVERADLEIDLGSGRTYRRRVTRTELEELIAPLVERTLSACAQALKAAEMECEGMDEVVLVGGATRTPLVRRRVGDLFARTPYTALNPDHVVALGAAVQGAVLAGVQRDVLLFDVTPLSLGIETMGGAMGKLILANTRVPCQAKERFTTFQDGQTKVKINVLQGERELAKDCRSLGVFELTGVPPMPAGIPQVEVTFLIDQNGILNVTARELRSGREAGIQIVPHHGLTREEVRRMTREAIAHAREDMTAHHLIDVRTTLEFDLNKTRQMLDRWGHLITAEERAELEQGVRELRAFAATCADPHELNRRREALDRAAVPLAEKAMSAALREQVAGTTGQESTTITEVAAGGGDRARARSEEHGRR